MMAPTHLRFYGRDLVGILHHAGDGNVPPVRVPSTVHFVRTHRAAAVLYAGDALEVAQLRASLGGLVPVYSVDPAVDTLGEIVATRLVVTALGLTTLYIATEPGHVDRATRLARIVYWRRGVRILPWPSAPGTYRSPWWLTVRDVVRAAWVRVTS